MNPSSNPPVHTLDDVIRFESAMPIEQRLPGRSVHDVFVASARRDPERTAITMLMGGAPGERPGVAYMLPSLVETHATLWGAEAGSSPYRDAIQDARHAPAKRR